MVVIRGNVVTMYVNVLASQSRCVPSPVLTITPVLTRNVPDTEVWTRIKSYILQPSRIAPERLPTGGRSSAINVRSRYAD